MAKDVGLDEAQYKWSLAYGMYAGSGVLTETLVYSSSENVVELPRISRGFKAGDACASRVLLGVLNVLYWALHRLQI